MSGFAPLLRHAAVTAASMLALATASAPALAKGPSVSVMVGTSTAYSNRDRVASSLLAGGMSRLAAISA